MTDFPTATDPNRVPPPGPGTATAVPEAAESIGLRRPGAPDVPVPRLASAAPAPRTRPAPAAAVAPRSSADAAPAVAGAPLRRSHPRSVPPVLEQLAELYPGLFGVVFPPPAVASSRTPMQGHPGVLDREARLKAGWRSTRSTRYLQKRGRRAAAA